jgi:hypothetical protein
MANRSNGDQQESIDPVLYQLFGDGRGQIFPDFPVGIDSAHEGVLERGDLPQKTFLLQSSQGIDGEDAIGIAPGIGHIIGKMGDSQVLYPDVPGNLPEGIIIPEMKGKLTRLVNSPGGTQRYPATVQGFLQRLPGRGVFIADPAVKRVSKPGVLLGYFLYVFDMHIILSPPKMPPTFAAHFSNFSIP